MMPISSRPISSRVDVVQYMCSKLGLDVALDAAKDELPYNMLSMRVSMLGHSIYPHVSLASYIDLPTDMYYAYATKNDIDWITASLNKPYSISLVDEACAVKFLTIDHFRVQSSRLCLGNPFYRHYEIANAETVAEACILADLANSCRQNADEIKKAFEEDFTKADAMKVKLRLTTLTLLVYSKPHKA